MTRDPLAMVNATHTASARSDDFIRTLLARWDPNRETGTVEWHGWFGIFHITREEIAAYVSEFGDPWMSERRNFEPGWYIVKQNNDGLVWAFAYASEGLAEVDFEKIDKQFTKDWSDE